MTKKLPNLDHAALEQATIDALTRSLASFDQIFLKEGNTQSIQSGAGQVNYYRIKDGANGLPDVSKAIDWLVKLAIEYVQTGTNIKAEVMADPELTDDEKVDEILDLQADACLRIVKSPWSGGFGESILWALIEAALKAPQAVAKLAHKSAGNVESFGMDAVHANYEASKQLLTLIWGESKIHGTDSTAIREAITDLNARLAPGGMKIEEGFLTRFPSQIYPDLEKHLKEYFKTNGKPQFNVAYEYAVFAGFNLEAYNQALKQGSNITFAEAYKQEFDRLKGLVKGHVKFQNQGVGTLHVFLLPLVNVNEARLAFEGKITNSPPKKPTKQKAKKGKAAKKAAKSAATQAPASQGEVE